MEKKIDTPDFVTDEQIDALMDDWFERDGETFVHKRKEDRLGWESRLAADSAYSEYMLSAPTEKELITRAYSLGRDTLVAMDLPVKVQVIISGNTSCTDGRRVFLATNVFDDKSLDTSEKLDVFLGYAVHEGSHILWTEFKPHECSKLCQAIANVLEDERIEILCGEHKPGFANFLEKTKAYLFDIYYKRVTEKELAEKGSLLDKFFDMFLKIIRFPKYLDEDMFIKFYKYLVRIKEILVPYPTSTASVYDAAEKIQRIIFEFYSDEMTKDAKKKAEEEAEKKKSESGGDKGEKSDTPGDGDESTMEPSGGDTSEEGGEEEGSVPTCEYKPTAYDVQRKVREDSESADFRKTTEIFDPASSESSAISDEIKKDSEFAEAAEGTISLGSDRDVIFTKANNSYDYAYNRSYEKIRRFIPAISKILKAHAQEYRYVLRGMRSGLLDTAKLAEAYQGVPTVYLREGEVKTDKISVCLLVDESGSMMGEREAAARDTAVLINEAIGKVPNVDLFIYGHTGDIRRTGTTEITIYREHGFDSRKALGGISAKCENRDGTAIYETAKRVRKQTKQDVLMFVISDGTPAARGYMGAAAMEHTRRMVEKTEALGFSVVQVCINPYYDPGKMFKHFVILKNMATLSVDLNKVIKNALLKATKKQMR